jgi:multicomponent Na+:H+ antiporter subunit D
MSVSIHPAAILLIGALLLPIVRGIPRKVLLVLLPILGFANLLGFEVGTTWTYSLAGYDLTILRVDKLSLIFAYLFHLAAFLAAVYALHLEDGLQHFTGTLYAGAAVGAVLAGDLITLFIFWELLAISSVFQIWARRTQNANDSGMRYLLIHITSGLLLLVGAALHYQETRSLAFVHLELTSVAAYLILLAIGVKCAFPLLHTWLVDSYPQATPTGTVYLSAFTTKTAV